LVRGGALGRSAAVIVANPRDGDAALIPRALLEQVEATLDKATPLYVQLIVLFHSNIETGRWPIGERIPGLDELAATFGVARATVRQSLSFLEREGLISRSRGRGTFVIAKPEGPLWLNIPASWTELVEQGETVTPDWTSIRTPLWEPDVSDISRGKPAPEYCVIRRILRREGVPYLLGTSYLDKRLLDEVGADAVKKLSVFRLLETSEKYRISHIDQSVHVSVADAEVAYLFQIPLNSPLVVVRRAGLSKNTELIYQSEGIMRGDFVRMTRQIL
jgi:GntR family transcriptional regulator